MEEIRKCLVEYNPQTGYPIPEILMVVLTIVIPLYVRWIFRIGSKSRQIRNNQVLT